LGLDLFVDWSRRSAKFDADNTRKRWDHYRKSPPERTNAGALFNLARQHYPQFKRPTQTRRAEQRKADDAAYRDAVFNEANADQAKSTPDSDPSDTFEEHDPDWPELNPDALHGPAGDIVRAIAPTTEADPVAILAHVLIQFGNAFGRRAYCVADGALHYPNEFGVTVGESAKGRKGTAARRVAAVTRATASDWADQCVANGGLSSGEGIIHAVRDDIKVQEKVTQKGKPPQYVEVVKPGIKDKRLYIEEPEFSGALSVMERQGSILSRVVRMAWDDGNLRTLIKNDPERATGAHISIIGHTTIDEYRLRLSRTDMVNGFGNRFLNFLVKRSRILPFGGQIADDIITQLAHPLHEAFGNTALRGEITFHHEGRIMWLNNYEKLSEAHPGLFGAITARAEAHTLRLALIYALLDQSRYIQPIHLRAAFAVWRYCEASAKYIFGDATGDPTADTILQALRHVGPDGMTRSEISNIFGHNKSTDLVASALMLLQKYNKVRATKRPPPTGKGRPTEIWKAA
jgi:Primase C terminal 2 (PriCT-2)